MYEIEYKYSNDDPLLSIKFS